jgi:hypothetical protein
VPFAYIVASCIRFQYAFFLIYSLLYNMKEAQTYSITGQQVCMTSWNKQISLIKVTLKIRNQSNFGDLNISIRSAVLGLAWMLLSLLWVLWREDGWSQLNIVRKYILAVFSWDTVCTLYVCILLEFLDGKKYIWWEHLCWVFRHIYSQMDSVQKWKQFFKE